MYFARSLQRNKGKILGNKHEIAWPTTGEECPRLKSETTCRAVKVVDGKRVLSAIRDDDSSSVGREANCRSLVVFDRINRIDKII